MSEESESPVFEAYILGYMKSYKCSREVAIESLNNMIRKATGQEGFDD